jgi:general stress protein YciG
MKMTEEVKEALRLVQIERAKKGGKARAEKYDRKTLSRWGKKGGRPPKKDGKR